jgi:hypothetical protein
MKIEKYTISYDPAVYSAWPDLVLTASGKLICVFSECTHHGDRSYTRIMLAESQDRGRTWSEKYPLTEGTEGLVYYYNCPRISLLANGTLVIIVDRIPYPQGEKHAADAINYLYFSYDNGESWSEPTATPLHGIVPDKLIELDNGRWIISAHYPVNEKLTQFMHYSDDQGKTWGPQITVASDPTLNLCEVSMLPLGNATIVAFMRENSSIGLDCKKVISYDNGESWGGIIDFPLPACHRPVAGLLSDGRVFITYRFMQGGKGWLGYWTQNFFAALTDQGSVLSAKRNDAGVRIIPIDYDPSPNSDLGYSGWVEFEGGEIYIVNYIVDDAIDKGQIRGYSLHKDGLMSTKKGAAVI